MDCSLCLDDFSLRRLDLSILYLLGRLIIFEGGLRSGQGRLGLSLRTP